MRTRNSNKICSEIWHENLNARGKMPATNTQTPSYANVAKNALIVKSADSGNITEKKVKITKALSDVAYLLIKQEKQQMEHWS